MGDNVLNELWETKDAIGRECGHNLSRLFERLKAVEKSVERPVVDRASSNKHGRQTRRVQTTIQ